MNSIKRILQLQNCGIFRDFRWPKELPEFGHYNLIYGWNWTGKSTLSKILRHMEKQTVPEGNVTLELGNGNGKLEGNDFKNLKVPVRVFNRDFVNESVFRKDSEELLPIFVLGPESVEKQKEVERLKGERTEAQSKLDSALTSKRKAENDFDQFCIDRAKVIKDTLRSSGSNPYNNYDKSDFRRDAETMVQAGDSSAHHLIDTDRDKLLAQHRATPKLKVPEVSYILPDFNTLLKTISDLLLTTVVSEAIKALKGDPALAEWTQKGLELHRERMAALEAHFSTQYEQFIQRLDQSIGKLQELSKAAAELRIPNRAELYDYLMGEYQTAEEGLKQTLTAVQSFLDAEVQALTEKKKRPFEQIERVLKAPSVDEEVVEKLNAVIRKHNQACDEFQTRVLEARKKLAEDMIAEVLSDFISKKGDSQEAYQNLQAAQTEIARLDGEIKRLDIEIVEHLRPAEEINEDLKKYLGHDELRLEVKETGYVISRAGVPAQALSEGEMTAIALLYFLKSLQDRQFDLANGIVVLDDPVSSLDANALYLAFGYIRDRTEGAGQLIILTHNFSFFRQVRNWFCHLKGQKKRDISQRPARFYMLDCMQDDIQRNTIIRQLDPLLEQYESEYHYLFACVYRTANKSASENLEQNYFLPNIARRLLESFLAFRQPATSGDLQQKMKDLKFDEAKKLRILRFLHTYSHSDAIDEPEHDTSLLAEARSVLIDLLELIESQDKVHYDEMVKLVTRVATEGDDE